jgi:hypothetical protein
MKVHTEGPEQVQRVVLDVSQVLTLRQFAGKFNAYLHCRENPGHHEG